MKVAIIPARGGSKRIPRKNIKNFCGKPMIAWSIEAAKESDCFDRIIVSTDDKEIAEVAKRYGAEVPFLRPADLSDDYTGTTEVIAHAVRWLNDAGDQVAVICCIYATAPFVTADDLIDSYRQFQQSGSDYMFSVTSYASPIQRAIRLSNNNQVSMFQPEHFKTRSQDLEEAWHDAGQFYWGQAAAWLENKTIFSSAATAYKLPRTRVQDIDTLEDWLHAEIKFKLLNF
jgi:N-acylneuraminate cytidylyltransferase